MKKAVWQPLALWGWPSTKGGEQAFVRFRKRQGGERSIYMPHQGEREIARRMRQDDAAHRKFIDSLVYRSLPKGVITHG